MQKATISILILFLFLVSCNSNKEEKPSVKAPSWLLSERKLFSYALNNKGLPDTTYVTNFRYEEGDLLDSTVIFIVNSYDGDGKLLSKNYFYRKGGKSLPMNVSLRNEYTVKGQLKSVSSFRNSQLFRKETFFYTSDSSQRIQQYSLFSPDGNISLPDDLDEINKGSVNDLNVGIDTVLVKYEYDKDNRVAKGIAMTKSGRHVKTDINIYSGSEPLATYTLGLNGDTIQKIEYKLRGKELDTRFENDSLVVVQKLINGYQHGQVTFFKNRNETWKKNFKYDHYGRPVEMKLYKQIID